MTRDHKNRENGKYSVAVHVVATEIEPVTCTLYFTGIQVVDLSPSVDLRAQHCRERIYVSSCGIEIRSKFARVQISVILI